MELITVSIYYLQIIFHQLMIAAILHSFVMAAVTMILTHHPVAHLFPHVESMKEIVITILNAKECYCVELTTVSIYYLQTIFHRIMIAAILHSFVMATVTVILIHVVVLGILVEIMKVIVIAMLIAMKVLCAESITVEIFLHIRSMNPLMIAVMIL